MLVMDERTMGGESLLLKTALPVSLELSSALMTPSSWRGRDVRRQPSASGRAAANRALIDTFRGRKNTTEFSQCQLGEARQQVCVLC